MGSQLPYRTTKIKLKDFDHDPKYKEYKGIFGICNMGKDEDEIWLNRHKLKIPSDTIELTKVHELVHVRRQQAEEEYENWRMEEDAVELEAVARCKSKYLNQAQEALKYFLIYDIKGKKKVKLHPDNAEDLKKIHKKIKQILLHKYRK